VDITTISVRSGAEGDFFYPAQSTPGSMIRSNKQFFPSIALQEKLVIVAGITGFNSRKDLKGIIA
jgi:hypothetical protein